MQKSATRRLEIAIDFDGTCVSNEYPKIGMDIGAVPVLKRLIDAGHRLILYTMRSGDKLTEAEKWFADNGIQLYGVQFNPTQKDWTASNKCYAQMYIDDAAYGAPLKFDQDVSDRYYIDWKYIEKNFAATGMFEK